MLSHVFYTLLLHFFLRDPLVIATLPSLVQAKLFTLIIVKPFVAISLNLVLIHLLLILGHR